MLVLAFTNEHDSIILPNESSEGKAALALPWGAGIGYGRHEWDRTTDHHHVKVVLYH